MLRGLWWPGRRVDLRHRFPYLVSHPVKVRDDGENRKSFWGGCKLLPRSVTNVAHCSVRGKDNCVSRGAATRHGTRSALKQLLSWKALAKKGRSFFY